MRRHIKMNVTTAFGFIVLVLDYQFLALSNSARASHDILSMPFIVAQLTEKLLPFASLLSAHCTKISNIPHAKSKKLVTIETRREKNTNKN